MRWEGDIRRLWCQGDAVDGLLRSLVACVLEKRLDVAELAAGGIDAGPDFGGVVWVFEDRFDLGDRVAGAALDVPLGALVQWSEPTFSWRGVGGLGGGGGCLR